jgi:hypothetical protein
MGEGRDVYRVLVGRAEGKRPLRRPTRRWKDNIKMNLRANWIRLAHDSVLWWAFVSTVMKFRIP